MGQEPSLRVIVRRPDQPGERGCGQGPDVRVRPRLADSRSFDRDGGVVHERAAVFGQPAAGAGCFKRAHGCVLPS